MKNVSAVFILLLVLFSSRLQADDGTEEYIGPQLLFSPPKFLNLESLDILVSDKKVTVDYTIKNNSMNDWTSEIIFNIPERSWYGYAPWYSNRGFSDLTVMINGQLLNYDRKAISYINGQDVSQKLTKAGLDPNLVDLDEFELANVFPEITPEKLKQYQALEGDGLIYLYLEPVTTIEKPWFQPRWSTANVYSWHQVFPADIVTKISYSYKPLPGVDRFSVEYMDINPYFLSLSGYDSLEALMVEGCTSWTEMGKLLPAENKYYAFEWFTFPLNRIKWAKPISRINFKVDQSDKSIQGKVSVICLSDKKFIGQPEMDIKIENVSIEKSLVLLLFGTL